MINIAIDGHVGSGKSTLARGLAKKLGFNVFDTGAIYRGLACEFKEKGYKSIDENTISAKYFNNRPNPKKSIKGGNMGNFELKRKSNLSK